MKYRILTAAALLIAVAAPLSAKKTAKVQPSRVPVYNTELPDKYQAGTQQYAYPVPEHGVPALTPAPEGYEPFHLEHYGRHGSRWLIGKTVYTGPVDMLAHADSLGQLTPSGQELLRRLRLIAEASVGRDGELTPLGARQHRGIARRITQNFPQLFTDSTVINARSTKVIRCILSMANEVSELERLFPGVKTSMDASQTSQEILAPSDKSIVGALADSARASFARPLRQRTDSDHSAFIGKVFTDPQFARDSLQADLIFGKVADICVNSQSHDGLYDLYEWFTLPELQGKWQNNNAGWYIHGGNTSLTDFRAPLREGPLLRDWLAGADTSVVRLNPSLNMRFGHDSVVLPLVCCLELGTYGADITDADSLAGLWRDYEITPMASNVQMIFYRPEGRGAARPEDVLVKIMLNEQETTMPVATDSWPYYPWTAVRAFMQGKLDKYDAIKSASK